MMRLRRASVIAALSLLASAATAYAEGPWVLWSKVTFRDGEGWLVKRAFDSAYESRVAAATALREAAGQGNMVVGDSVKTADGELTPVYLPDTVDPRAPTGSEPSVC